MWPTMHQQKDLHSHHLLHILHILVLILILILDLLVAFHLVREVDLRTEVPEEDDFPIIKEVVLNTEVPEEAYILFLTPLVLVVKFVASYHIWRLIAGFEWILLFNLLISPPKLYLEPIMHLLLITLYQILLLLYGILTLQPQII